MMGHGPEKVSMLNFSGVICQVVLVCVLQKTFCKKNKNYIYIKRHAFQTHGMCEIYTQMTDTSTLDIML